MRLEGGELGVGKARIVGYADALLAMPHLYGQAGAIAPFLGRY
ncbi:MAG: hypothetical protein AAGA01_04980 [Cyanobacteria bacterium P01_E01_bin.43]